MIIGGEGSMANWNYLTRAIVNIKGIRGMKVL